MRKSNYDKYPLIKINNNPKEVKSGWEKICDEINHQIKQMPGDRYVLTFETYPGVKDVEILSKLFAFIKIDIFIITNDLYKSEVSLNEMCLADITDDRVFGYMTRLKIEDFFDSKRLQNARNTIEETKKGVILIYGCGASVIPPRSDLFIYADMARWEIQQRMRKGEVANLGTNDFQLDPVRKYKRAYFVDWRVADRLKRNTFDNWDYIIDSNTPESPVMISAKIYKESLQNAVTRPFRLVPFFDPGPWGGQWMKEVCDLDKTVENYAWCFDCVPEENSIQFDYQGIVFESPAINLVFFQPKELLGERVYARFGAEFPIRFDFLDTVDGGNLSLQVHPTTEYIREHFGMFYTQDESYYMLDAREDASVFLGVKTGIDPKEMMDDLKAAQNGGPDFDASKYIARWPAKKHDHFLIPAGTVHCSGTNCMVLEISATPYIFTFKLWDWGRKGMDGLPRPIHIDHGEKVIQWDRTDEWVQRELINQIQEVSDNGNIKEEITGLHDFEFIETVRHWFTEKVTHETQGSVHVLNLVEGEEAIVESPDGAFEPFHIHYAETFIVPAAVGSYSVRPMDKNATKPLATIRASIKKQ